FDGFQAPAEHRRPVARYNHHRHAWRLLLLFRIRLWGQTLRIAGFTPCSVSMMTSQEILAFITGIGIVPIVRVASADSAVEAVEAIYRGGVRAAEITMTVPGAIRALQQVADRLGDKMMLGAGTVLDPETARACMLAGAQFFVTPALRLSTIAMAKRYSKVVFPGALTPTEVLS